MKKLNFVLFLLFCSHVQAAPVKNGADKHQVAKIVKKTGYSWRQQFVESIEKGEDLVRKYVAIHPRLLTKNDKLSGLTPLEIAVVADNEAAMRTILALAFERDKKLALSMAMNKAKELNRSDYVRILTFSCVQDEDIRN